MHTQLAVITGAGSGIGRGIAKKIADEGKSLALIDINESGVDETIELINTDVEIIKLIGDVTNENDIKRMVNKINSTFKSIDILVTSAGISEIGPAINMELSAWNRVLEVNLTGTFLICKEIAPYMMKQQNGRIITIASINGKEGTRLSSAYSASKHGVLGFTSALALELAEYGITVNSVCPGPVETELLHKAWEIRGKEQGKDKKEYLEAAVQRVPLGRLATPSDIAGVVSFLASPSASYITRSFIDVTGGLRQF